MNSKGNKAVWKKTLTHDLMRTPNSVLPLSDHEVLFTNDHMFKIETNRVLAQIETYLAFPSGSLIYLNTKTNVAHKLAGIPFANGIGRLNNTHIAVSSTTTPAVLIYALSENRDSAILKQKLRPKFCVDNLRVDSNGKLLIAGHPHVSSITKVSETNQHYDLDGSGEARLLPEKDRPRAPSWVVDWDGNPEGTLRDIYIGNDYGTSTTATRDVKRGIGFISGLYEKGILVWKE
jgi:arylesterase / paraoxonase